jgi:hypothetical protein
VRCQRPGCGKPIPEGRRKYCSDKCARIVNRDSAAARARRREAAIAAKGGPHVRPRICLSCNKSFLSEGPWNRICPRCSERNVAVPPRATASRSGLHGGDLDRMLGD